jgi:hypothetical protein
MVKRSEVRDTVQEAAQGATKRPAEHACTVKVTASAIISPACLYTQMSDTGELIPAPRQSSFTMSLTQSQNPARIPPRPLPRQIKTILIATK